MTLRPAEMQDVAAMAQIMADWFEETPYVPVLHSFDEHIAFLAKKLDRADVLVADQEGVQGFILRNGDEIGQFYLAGTARGQGLGTALLGRMKARSDHLTLWCFQANVGARRFYERHGFVPTGTTEGENEEGVPDIRYAWSAR